MSRIIIKFCIIFFLSACTSQSTYKTMIKWKQEHFDRDFKEAGIFVQANEYIFIKVHNEQFVKILDNLAYKMRFNYTLSTKMHHYRLTINSNNLKNSRKKKWHETKQIGFKNIRHFIKYAINLINLQYYKGKKRLGCSWEGDGPEFFDLKKNESRKIILKKIFCNNFPVKEFEKNQNENNIPETGLVTDESENLSNIGYNQQDNKLFLKDKILALLLSEEEKEQIKIIEIETQNALIIHGNRKVIDKISNLISLIDIEYPHILVETKVFEYDDSLIKEAGLSFNISKNNKDNEIFDENQKENFSINSISETEISPLLLFRNLNAEKRLAVLTKLAFSDKSEKVKILAEPRLFIKPGSFAKISLKAIKYVTSVTNSTETPEQIETGIKFAITPYIIGANKIMLDVMVEQSEFIPNKEEDVLQYKSQNIINTRIVAYDGELVSLGGIIENKKSKNSSGIPYLKDIPVLGYLFKYNNSSNSAKRIEFLIRPTTNFLHNRLDSLKDEIHTLDMQNFN